MIARAPARICLFGEHQDYLGHPVIAGAVNLFFHFRGEKLSDRRFIIHKRDLHETEEFIYPETGCLPYQQKRDYFRSSLNVLRKRGLEIPHGAELEIWSEVPINAGSASSSVMIVAWLRFLCELFAYPQREDPMIIAEMAHEAEVLEFNEPGGKMDHYSSSLGGIVFMDFNAGKYTRLRDAMDGFVLVNSREKKDTLGGLSRIKGGQIEALNRMKERFPGKMLQDLEPGDLDFLPPEIEPYGRAALINYRLTLAGKDFLSRPEIDHESLGSMLNQQHRTFREYFKNTTEKIDSMMDRALEAGALGGKMNGSGGGGTFFIYCPGREEAIMEALRQFDADGFKISII